MFYFGMQCFIVPYKENAIKYYRNKQDYPHANPDAVLEVMYLGADGNFKRKNY